jgi:hypothetical protein
LNLGLVVTEHERIFDGSGIMKILRLTSEARDEVLRSSLAEGVIIGRTRQDFPS